MVRRMAILAFATAIASFSGCGSSSSFVPTTPVPAMPTLVRRSSGSNTLAAQLSNTPSVYHAYLPDGAIAGNTIVAAFQYDNTYTPTPSFSDDKSNTWHIGCTEPDTTHSQVIGWAYASNVIAGTRAVDLSLAASSAVSFIAVHVLEFANLGAIDGCSGNFGVSTSVMAKSITPTSSGDLLLQTMAKDGGDTQSTITAGSQSNIAWQLATADLQDQSAMGVQWGIYSSTSAIMPTMTTGGATNNDYVSAAIAFKAASAGGDIGSGIAIRGLLHFSRFGTSFGGGPGYTNPTKVAFPSYGNTLVVAANGNVGTTAVLSSITDTNGNTWTQTLPASNASGAQADEFWYCSPCTTGPSLVLTVSSANGDGNTYNQNLNGYDIANGASSAFDTYGDATGDQNSYAGSITGASVTPSTANGLVLCELDNANNTVTGMSGTGFLIDSEWYNNESFDGPENVDENNGWGHLYNTSASQVTCIFTYGLHGTDAQTTWAATAAAFKAR